MSERKKRYRTASWLTAIGIGASAATGCGAESDLDNSPRYAVEVVNTSDRTIEMSNHPRMGNNESRVGTIEPGQKAVALCLTAGSDIPKNMGLRARRGDAIGYIRLFSAGNKDLEGAQQLAPGYEELRLLPPCYPPVKAKLKTEVNVHTVAGRVDLPAETLVTTECKNGRLNVKAKIESGPYDGQTTDNLPLSTIEATNDPYGASVQRPPADPFLPLPDCTEV